MSTVGSASLADVLRGRMRGVTELADLATAVCDAYRTRINFGFACLATMDPATGLISWAMKTRPLEVGDEEFAAAEYGGPDINLFAEIAARPEPVGVLSIDTAGHVESCRRFRDFLAPRFGFTDELRVVFRSRALSWGALALYREAGDPPFTAADAEVAGGASAEVAALIQDVLFRSGPATAGPGPGPAVIVVDAADRVLNMTPAVPARIGELGGWDNGSLPATVLVSCAAARTSPDRATNRAVGVSGSFLIVRATTFAPADPDPTAAGSGGDVVVTIDDASAADVSSLALNARGLSAREQEVAAKVLQGGSTAAIAAALFMSPHTVQDHLKSIFAKLGVNSRREMVQLLVVGRT